MGAEYYSPKYLKPFSKLIASQIKIKNLSNCCVLITDGDHGSADYVDRGEVTFVLSEAVKDGWIDKSACRNISFKYAENLKRSKLEKNDVLITKTGIYFGKSAVVSDEFVGANTIAHVGLLRPKSEINPYYLSTFFNSIYGYSQLRRRGIKATRPEIKLIEFQDIKVGLPSDIFQRNIADIIILSKRCLQKANSTYKHTENLLLRMLGLNNILSNIYKINIKTFKKSFAKTGRLDAEYYQKRYEIYRNIVHSYGNSWKPLSQLCQLKDANFTPNDNDIYRYIELANIDKLGGILGFTTQQGKELPSRARRKIEENDVLIPSIEGSLSSCAIVPEVFNNSICSTGFYVINSNIINSETLLVLFKSELMQNLLKQNCSGTILSAINKEEFLNLPLPVINSNIQIQIADFIQQSFSLRAESERLLKLAKKAVEIAIEQNEDAAMKYIQ